MQDPRTAISLADMDPQTLAAILVGTLGALVVFSLAWRLRLALEKRSTRKQRDVAIPQAPPVDGQPMRARDMRAADIEGVLKRAVDDIFRPG